MPEDVFFGIGNVHSKTLTVVFADIKLTVSEAKEAISVMHIEKVNALKKRGISRHPRSPETYDNPIEWILDNYEKDELAQSYTEDCSNYVKCQEKLKACALPFPDESAPLYEIPQPDNFPNIPPSKAESHPELLTQSTAEKFLLYFVSRIKSAYRSRPTVGYMIVGRGQGLKWIAVRLKCKAFCEDKLPKGTHKTNHQVRFWIPGAKEAYASTAKITRLPFMVKFAPFVWLSTNSHLCQFAKCVNLAHIEYEDMQINDSRNYCPAGSLCDHVRSCFNKGCKFLDSGCKERLELEVKSLWISTMTKKIALDVIPGEMIQPLHDLIKKPSKVKLEYPNVFVNLKESKKQQDIIDHSDSENEDSDPSYSPGTDSNYSDGTSDDTSKIDDPDSGASSETRSNHSNSMNVDMAEGDNSEFVGDNAEAQGIDDATEPRGIDAAAEIYAIDDAVGIECSSSKPVATMGLPKSITSKRLSDSTSTTELLESVTRMGLPKTMAMMRLPESMTTIKLLKSMTMLTLQKSTTTAGISNSTTFCEDC